MAYYDITSGVTSTGLTLENDSMCINNGGVASNTTVNTGGEIYISSGGKADKTTVNDSGFVAIFVSGLASSTIVNSGGELTVDSGGTAGKTTVNSRGSMNIEYGGLASSATFNNDGYLNISSGGTAIDTTVNEYSFVNLYSGGIASRTTVNSSGKVNVNGTANGGTVSGGSMLVYSGGIANDIKVRTGYIFVDSGGTATGVIEDGGVVKVGDGANVTFKANTFSGLVLSSASATVHSGTTANRITLDSSGYLHVFSGGIAIDTKVNSGGGLFVSSGGAATGVTLDVGTLYVYTGGTADGVKINSGGYLAVSSGGTATGVTLDIGTLYVNTGGVANNTTVNSGGRLTIFSGGSAKITENGGWVNIGSGAEATFVPNTFSGLVLSSASATVHKNTTATGITLNSSGSMFVYSGGILNGAKVNSGGRLTISSGGKATEILENGGYVWVGGGANVKFKANKLTGLALEKTSVTVHSGTTADKFTLADNGNLYVYTGGVANNTTVNSRGYMTVSGGKTDKVTVNSGGAIYVYSGTATNVTVNSSGTLVVYGSKADKVTVKTGALVYVYSGGTATGVDWTPCEGNLVVYAGGTVKFKNKLSGVYYGSGGKQLEQAAEMDGKTLDSGCELVVMTGGTANNVTVNESGTIRIYSGGRADDAIVNSGGSIFVYTGGAADHAALNESGCLFLHGGTADQTAVNSGGYLGISKGGMAKNTTVNGGELNVYSGGTAKRVAMSGGASLYIGGGSAFGVEWTPCEGRIQVASGGSVTYRNSRFSGVYFGDGSSLLSHDVMMDGKTLGRNYEMFVYSGGMANNTTLDGYCNMYVYSGGMADNTILLSGGSLHVSSGGMVNGGTVSSGGYMNIIRGSANGVTIDNYGRMSVGYLATADNTTVSSGGRFCVYNSGTVNNVTVESRGSAYIALGSADFVVIKSGGSFELDGGTANNVTIEAGGSMSICSGASLNNTTLTSARLRVTSKAVAENTTVSSGGTMSVYYGGAANHTFVNFSAWMFVEDSGIASNTTVSSGGTMYVKEKSEAHGLTVSDGGVAIVSANASADDVTVCSDGSACVASGGVLANVSVQKDGILDVNEGGILTGSQTFAGGATVTLNDGAGVVFDVSGLTAADCSTPFLSDYTALKRVGDQSWKIAVSNVQSFGTYALAGWADSFDKTVTVVNDAWEDTGVTLEVGDTRDIFGASHSLQIIGTRLVLIVGESENMEPADTGWNDTLYDKKSKTLNKAVYGMDAQAVTADTRELLIDTAGTVRALDDMHNFIGNSPSSGRLDAADFTKIELATAAKLSFNAYSGQAAKFTVWQLTEGKDKKGATTYTMKSLTSATLKGGYAGVSTSKKPLLLEAGTYYVSMELSNAKKAGEDGYYSVTIDDSSYATEFYTRADNSDDWDDMKENGPYGRNFGSLGVLSDNSFDEGFLVSDGWVGFSDAVDYMQFELQTAAKLGFYVGATDATKFTIWKLNSKTGKNGVTTYSLKSLQSVTLKKEGEYNYYADTYDKPVILDAGIYYMSVESTNAKKGGSATYSISLSGGEFYTRVDNGDDWGDMKTDGANGLVGDVGRLSTVGVILEDWVGYGDAIDYKEFTLTRKTSLSFSVFSGDAAKFTVWRLDGKTDKKGVTTYSLKALGTKKIGAGNTEQTQEFTLDAGSYYFSMESVNAKKGASCDYTVELASFVESDSLSAALTMPEADVLADVSAVDKLASLDDASAWQSLLA